MLDQSTRPFTENELSDMRQWDNHPHRRGFVGMVAFYGTYWFLMPVAGCGIIGKLLTLVQVPDGPAYAIGLIFTLIFSVYLFVWEFKAANLVNQYYAKDLKDGQMDVIKATIERAWPVEDPEDLGFSYLLQVENDQFMFVASQRLFDQGGWDESNEKPALTRTIVVERLPLTKEIMDVTWSGEPIEVDQRQLTYDDLPDDIVVGCVLLTNDQVPKDLFAKI